jgi:hypothetical protein
MHRNITSIIVATAIVTLMVWPMVSRAQLLPPGAGISCLHDETASAADRARLEQARAVARAINLTQGRAAEVTRRYLPLSQLIGLPQVPDGFELRLYTDGDGYVLSLKDTRDPCHYGIFSDQHGRLYEMAPQVPMVAK